MSAITLAVTRGGAGIARRLSGFWTGISAVGIKELRGRMRGRRAFVVLTVYLLLLSLFAFAIYTYLRQQATQIDPNFFGGGMEMDFRRGGWFPGMTQTGTALSAAIGHAIFGGLLMVETLLVLVLAPAFTTGAISLEREKQTLDLLVTTPLSTLGMVTGKLLSALTYVFLLIIASIPLASLVFVFGAVGPEDLLRAYAFLFALAFGMGAIGLFISALVKRTQTATVITFVLVLVLSIGTVALHQFWNVTARPANASSFSQSRNRPPEAVLWLNPFVADLDMICATAPDAYHLSCAYMSSVTGRAYYGVQNQPGMFGDDAMRFPMPMPAGGFGGGDFAVPESCPPNALCVEPGQVDAAATTDFGFPRDTFWPKSAAAFVGLGLVLTLLAAQLVAPTRRLRLPRPGRPRLRLRRRAVGA
jgi:ABC-type transport system involved in multi-copper enzyme maturation permease subunit